MKIDKSKIESQITELEKYTSHQGKVLPRRVTKFNVQEQRKLQSKVKLARALSLMPFVRREG
jgi:ribosomal protein S18